MASNPIMVVVFLRGGCDGLNLVGPSADPIYITERKAGTRVDRDGDYKGLPLTNTFADSDFRFHGKATQLCDLYNAKHLAIVHATGLTNGTRSHFEAQDYMERGTPDNKNTPTGWLTRLVAEKRPGGIIPVVATSDSLPASLLSCPQGVAVPAVSRIQVQGNPRFKATDQWFLNHYYAGGDPVTSCGLHSLNVVNTLAAHAIPGAKPNDYTPTAGVVYPMDGAAGALSNSFKTVAQLIKMNVGIQFATVDYGGWDTHVNQAGRFAAQVAGLSGALSAFWNDMASYQSDLTVVVISEFGRRLKSNDSGGTDHGHGNAMLVLGGKVNGGNIYGKWPGLDNANLSNGVDLAVTTDYRQVLSEIASKKFQLANVGTIFPRYTDYKPLGIYSA